MSDYKTLYELGKRVGIDDLSYEAACEVFGKPLVDAYHELKKKPPIKMRVTKVDARRGIIQLSLEEE